MQLEMPNDGLQKVTFSDITLLYAAKEIMFGLIAYYLPQQV
jgi:hypothetical protein